MKSPDNVFSDYENKSININCKKLDNDTILIEGDRASLEFLGQLIISQANYDKDCGVQFGPKSSGNTLFSKEAELGLYIHRVPCEHKKE
jgi:hypothetical protein